MAGLIAPVARMIEEFSKLPGIGTKTAQRLTYHVLRASTDDARSLAAALISIKEDVAYCSVCCNITEADVDPCHICADSRRDTARICVVEEPLDVLAIERTGEFRGRYHVLHGAISPIDGIGPERLRTRELMVRVTDGASRRSSWPQTPTSRARRRRCTSPTCSTRTCRMSRASRADCRSAVTSSTPTT